MPKQTETKDPREGPKPPFEEPAQPVPGSESKMREKPDHGEGSYRGFGRLSGKAALITGADSGIGKAVAIAYAREGADVAVSYLPEEEDDARDTVGWIERAGRAALALPGDIRDILVNNAAYQMTHDSIEEFSSEEWDRTFRTNIYAMFYLAKAAMAHMPPGERHRQHRVRPGIQAYREAAGLCQQQGCYRDLHQGALGVVHRAGHPRERGGTRTGVDPAHPQHNAPGACGEVRPDQPHDAARPAGRTGPGVRVSGLRRVFLYHRLRDGPDRREDAAIAGCFRNGGSYG